MLSRDSDDSLTSPEITFKGKLILNDSSQFYFSASSDATRDGLCFSHEDLDSCMQVAEAEDEEVAGISVPELKTHSADCLSSTKTYTAFTEDSQLHSARLPATSPAETEIPNMAETAWRASLHSKEVTPALMRIIQANSGLGLKVCEALPPKTEYSWCCR
jgi:hypothetical protein